MSVDIYKIYLLMYMKRWEKVSEGISKRCAREYAKSLGLELYLVIIYPDFLPEVPYW